MTEQAWPITLWDEPVSTEQAWPITLWDGTPPGPPDEGYIWYDVEVDAVDGVKRPFYAPLDVNPVHVELAVAPVHVELAVAPVRVELTVAPVYVELDLEFTVQEEDAS